MIYILNNHYKIYNKLVNNVNEFKLNNFTDEKVAEKYINNFNIVLKKFKEIQNDYMKLLMSQFQSYRDIEMKADNKQVCLE